MTDPFDQLKSEMDARTPIPDADRRDEVLARAVENFDNFHSAPQGSGSEARPIIDRRNFAAVISEGAKFMYATLTSRGGLAATTALVAVGLVIAIPALQTGPLPFPSDDLGFLAEEPVMMEEPMVAEDYAMPAQPPQQQERVALDQLTLERRAGNSASMKSSPQTATMAQPADGVVAGIATPEMDADLALSIEANTETFANGEQNPLSVTAQEPVSTFSIDVDTASYAVARSSLNAGQLPNPDSVRAEEFINYFSYDYPEPETGNTPFRPTISVMDTPWNAGTQLLQIALQGQMPAVEDRPPLNLVFLVDTSGSMSWDNKLPLLKQSLRLMLGQMRPEDEIAIITYAGSAAVVLEPTSATDTTTIYAALTALGAGGSTAGADGLRTAYEIAGTMQKDGEVSRVLLATDGDFNVGLSDPEALKTFIADKRDDGAYLSVLGFGRGNLDDATMQALAQNGDGQAAYIDTLAEAQKVLVDQLTGALFPIANDVKIQVEFNPARVAEYRLIGYETRALNREDFNNDRVDAGEIGAGHRVTAIYEITPTGSDARFTDPLRYGAEIVEDPSGELGFLRLRYKSPGEDISQLIETPITDETLTGTGVEQQFAAAIAGFAQLLRGNEFLGDWGYEQAIELAAANRGADAFGYRQEAITLMRLANSLSR